MAIQGQTAPSPTAAARSLARLQCGLPAAAASVQGVGRGDRPRVPERWVVFTALLCAPAPWVCLRRVAALPLRNVLGTGSTAGCKIRE